MILKEDTISIRNSLRNNSIGITDMIFSCTREDKSALDKHLKNRIYNHHFFDSPKQGKTIKILCTSKGVMNEMLLSNSFFKLNPQFKINIGASNAFQSRVIKKIKGDLSIVRKPFYQIIEVDAGGTIECMSIPSPGSPYRRLVDFGINVEDAEIFLNNYLRVAFHWFTS